MIFIYARQSLDKKDSISIDMQVEYCKREFDSENEPYQVFCDKGFSGKNTQRPAFSQMLDEIMAGGADKIIVYRLDRISRSITDFAAVMDMLEQHNVSFISSTEKFDTSSPMGRAMLYIIMVFAQLERETIAGRIRDNYYERGKSGVFLGGPPPFGFRNVKQKEGGRKISVLQPNEDIALVKQIFDLYANTDCSLGKIARIIKADRPAELWNNIKLSRILHNPSYVAADADIYHYYKSLGCVLVNPIEEFTGEKGCMLYGKRDRGANKYRNLNEHVLSLGLHDGVVSSATFLACQRKLASNQQIKNSGKGKHTWLTGLLKCGACGYSMVVKTYQESKYLYCSGKQNNQCDATFQNFSLDDVETIIQNAVCEKLDLLPADAAQKQQQQNTAEINELKIALYKIEDEIQSLMGKLAAANDVLTAYINRRILELDEQKHALNDKIGKTLQKEETAALPTQEEFLSGDMAFKKKTASRLIEKIYIKKDDIEIVWK